MARRTLGRTLAILLLILVVGGLVPAQPAGARSWLRWAYYVPDDPRSYASLVAHHNALDVVSPDAWRLQIDGSITSNIAPSFMAGLRGWGLQVFPMVQKRNWADHMHAFWASSAARARAAAQLTALVVGGGYPGIHLDLENINRADGPAYTAFVDDIAARLHAQGRLLTLALPAKAGGPDGYPEYDYRTLGRVADLLVIMAYDYGYSLGPPMAVAPMPWFEAVLRNARQQIPANKLIMGMPWYGYDWNTTTHAPGTYISAPAAQARAQNISYNWQSQAPVATYWSNGRHTIWYENAQSVAAKLNTVVRYDVRGWAAWRLGYEDPAIWTNLTPRR